LSKNVAIFIDVANLYYAARGQDVDVDYVALLKHATKGRDLIRAYAYSGLDPENENQRKFLDFLSKNGYKVVHKDIRKFGDGRVKANLDIELVVDLFRLADRMDIAVIVSGDGDFASAIRALQDVGVRCEVISFRPNTSSDLIAVADEFTDIMKIIGIGRKKGEKGVSMPEMPAKEVNPEFGFREASRGVAAAALAAIREGEKPAGRSRRGRGAPKADEAAVAALPIGEEPSAGSEEPVEPMTALEAHVDGTNGETTRRRRRRRGGRGRGRGRRAEAQEDATVAAEPTDAEIGWQEFDDISQLGLTDPGEPGGEREFTFEEADAQTLEELGIEPGAGGETVVAEADVLEEPQPAAPAETGGRRRRRSSKSDESGSAAGSGARNTAGSRSGTRTGGRRKASEAASTGEATAPRRSSRGGSRVGAQAAETPDGSEPAKPAAKGSKSSTRSPRSSRAGSRSPKQPTEADAAGEGGQADPEGEEGIWQRFRSGRRPARTSR
jgi:uncharacterized LabA/DUF88 family protein